MRRSDASCDLNNNFYTYLQFSFFSPDVYVGKSGNVLWDGSMYSTYYFMDVSYGIVEVRRFDAMSSIIPSIFVEKDSFLCF